MSLSQSPAASQSSADAVVSSAIAQGVPSDRFVYQPPASALGANRILVKPNLGYPVGPPVTVGDRVLAEVLRALRVVAPTAEILIVEGVCSPVSLAEIADRRGLHRWLDEGMRLVDADSLPLVEYENRSPEPVRFRSMWAPALIQEVDCRVSIGALKRTHLKGEPLISASLKNLYGLFPRDRYKARSPHSRGQLHRPSVPLVLQDVYFCIGHWFDGGVVDGTVKYFSADYRPDRGQSIALERVFFGSDLLTVDRLACQEGDEPIPDYLEAIDRLRSPLADREI
jgi:hypothetical protein